MRILSALIVLFVYAVACEPSGGQETSNAIPQKVSDLLARLDQGKDGTLTEAEYVAHFGDKRLAARDFRLSDWDDDGRLSVSEFWSVSLWKSEERGPVPDPIAVLVDEVLHRIVQQWPGRSDDRLFDVPVAEFKLNALAGLNVPGLPLPTREVDVNGNGNVSLNEARRFVEILFGVRRSDGHLLRQANAMLFNLGLYRHVDLGGNDRITRGEFLARADAGDQANDIFDSIDLNHDGQLTFEECWQSIPFLYDPLSDFRRYDTDLDAFISPQELKAGLHPMQVPIGLRVFPAFDRDRDVKLSVNEFRMCPLAHPAINWHEPLTESDFDGKLTFEDFAFGARSRFPLLRWEMFQCLDQNHDSSLDEHEFAFKTRIAGGLFTLNSDGTGWKKLSQLPGHFFNGKPSVSPDGKQLALAATDLVQEKSTLFVINVDGRQVKKLGWGAQPTWSADGAFLSVWRSEANPQGVWILKSNGEEHRHISNGWGGEWSPDGRKIAYSETSILKVFDIETQQSHEVMGMQNNPYLSVLGQMCWSPDSTQLLIKGVRPGNKMDFALVNAAGAELGFKVRWTTSLDHRDISWHPSGHRIIVPMWCPERARVQLYELNPLTNDAPKLVPGQDPKLDCQGAGWFPDGKRMVVAAGVN